MRLREEGVMLMSDALILFVVLKVVVPIHPDCVAAPI